MQVCPPAFVGADLAHVRKGSARSGVDAKSSARPLTPEPRDRKTTREVTTDYVFRGPSAASPANLSDEHTSVSGGWREGSGEARQKLGGKSLVFQPLSNIVGVQAAYTCLYPSAYRIFSLSDVLRKASDFGRVR